MPNTRISQLTDLAAAPASGDLVAVVDVSDTTQSAQGSTKKVSVSNFLANVVQDTGNETIAGVKTFSSDPLIPDEAYDASAWNQSLEPPTKNAVRDKIETIVGVSDGDKGDIVVSSSGTVWSIDTGAIVNADISASAAIALSKLATDPLARANHTGTQTASTVSDFAEAVDDRVGTLVEEGDNVSATYDDTAGTLTIDTQPQVPISNLDDLTVHIATTPPGGAGNVLFIDSDAMPTIDYSQTAGQWAAISGSQCYADSTPASGRFIVTFMEWPFEGVAITGFKLQVGTVKSTSITLSRFALYNSFSAGRTDGSVGDLILASASDTASGETANTPYARSASAATVSGIALGASYTPTYGEVIGVGFLAVGTTPMRIRAAGTNPGFGNGAWAVQSQTMTGLSEVPATITIDTGAQGGAAMGWHNECPWLPVTW